MLQPVSHLSALALASVFTANETDGTNETDEIDETRREPLLRSTPHMLNALTTVAALRMALASVTSKPEGVTMRACAVRARGHLCVCVCFCLCVCVCVFECVCEFEQF